MADRLLFISWGATVRGREQRGLEVFNGSLAFYGRCQNEELIESFDVVIFGAAGAHIHGYIQLHGSAQQLAAMRENPEFIRILTESQLIVDDLAVVGGYANQGVADVLGGYQEAIAAVPQLA